MKETNVEFSKESSNYKGKKRKKGGGEGEEKTGSIAQVEQIKLAVKNNLQT